MPPACLQYQKDKSSTPSNFTLKLRKHLRARRLEDVRQLGVDRIVDFQFGSGEAAYHLILELYSQVTVCIVDFQFGSGQAAYHLILELHAQVIFSSAGFEFGSRQAAYPLILALYAQVRVCMA